MDISLGFVIITVLILFPGLIYRRFYFYGHFSNQFYPGNNTLKTITSSVIPGVIMLITFSFIYHNVFTSIDFEFIINRVKEINDPNLKLKDQNDSSLKTLIAEKIVPFIGFLYLTSSIAGASLSRLIRFTKLDITFKELRFNDNWFYIFNDKNETISLFSKNKNNKKHLFTKADILIEQNGKSALYSGVVVDYVLSYSNENSLSKIVLQNALRYSFQNNERKVVPIPGNVFIVDCLSMKNINLTYVYDEAPKYSKKLSEKILKSNIPSTFETILGFVVLMLIPVFIFKIELIRFEIYQNYFNLSWYAKILAYISTIFTISLLFPFENTNNEYKYVTWQSTLSKLLIVIFFGTIFYLVK